MDIINKKKKKISIVTPSFNQGEYLEETIDSVLSQKYPNLEYIIMDGGSNDNSFDIIKKYEKYLTYWESKPDRGQSHAINKGLKKCTGDVFNWLCSDDYLEKGSLQVIGELFQDKSIHITSGKFRVFGDGENTIQNGTTVFGSLEETLAKVINMQPSTFFRTELVKEANGVNEKLHYFMDKELLMKIIFKYGIDGFKSLDELIAHYRIQKQSKTYLEMDHEMLNPKSKFKIDANSIYFSLAKQFEFNKYQKIITTFTSELLDGYKFNSINSLNKDEVESVLNYYIFNEALKWFYKGKKNKCFKILGFVNKKILNSDYQKDFKYLYRKSILPI
jgi:glycosyltransferase involved in cell wall biosynthesis